MTEDDGNKNSSSRSEDNRGSSECNEVYKSVGIYRAGNCEFEV